MYYLAAQYYAYYIFDTKTNLAMQNIYHSHYINTEFMNAVRPAVRTDCVCKLLP